MIQASCHCGNVKIDAPNITAPVISCNCSVCGRYGALWAHLNPRYVNINCSQDQLGSYCWGDKTIDFHHCKNCGCLTHYTPTDKGNAEKMAVNFRLVPAKIREFLKVRHFDGADSWEFIDE